MRLSVILCCLLLNIVLLLQSNAQNTNYLFRNFTVDDGLLSSTIYTITQDDDGYIWLGTDAGVNRFDGHHFSKYTIDDGLEDNEVINIFKDSSNRLWFLSLNGKLSFYQRGKIYNSGNLPLLKKTQIGSEYIFAYEDSRGTLWFNTNNKGVLEIRPDSSILHHNSDQLAGTKYCAYTYETLDGSIFQVSGDTVTRIRGNSVMNWNPILKLNNYCSRAEMGFAFFYSKDGLAELSDTNISLKYKYPPGILYTDVTSAIRLRNKDIILNTLKGTYRIKAGNDTWESAVLLPDLITMSTFSDHEGNLWISTAGKGLFMLPNKTKRWKHITASEGLSSLPVFSMLQLDENNLVAGGQSGKIFFIRDNIIYKTEQVFNSDYTYNRIRFLAMDRNKRLWCGSDKGITIVPLSNPGSFYSLPFKVKHSVSDLKSRRREIFNLPIKALGPDTSGSMYCTYHLGVVGPESIDPDKKYYFISDSSRIGKRTFYHFFDSSNRIWISDIEGLHYEQGPGNPVPIKKLNERLKNRIITSAWLKDGRLLTGSDGDGLFLLSDTTLIAQYGSKDGLPSNVCRRIICSPLGIFICTNNGLARIRISGDEILVEEIYGIHNGLLSNDVFDVCIQDDLLFAATSKGISSTSLLNNELIVQPPPLQIEAFIADNQKYDPETKIVLKPGTGQIHIDFIGIAFQNPQKILYQYALAANDTLWQSTMTNSVEFPELPPGNYKFLLRSKGENSGWSKIRSINFEIRSYIWEQLWFKILSGFIILLFVFISIRLWSQWKYNRKIRMLAAEQALESERMRIAMDMHDDVGSELTKIAILSNVMISRQSEPDISDSVHRIATLSSGVLQKMDEIIWALNPGHDQLSGLIAYLRSYILETADSSKKDIRLEFTNDSGQNDIPLKSAIRRTLFLVVKEAVSNAIRHSGCESILIPIRMSNKILEIEIHDQGCGFDLLTVNSQGMGLTNMLNRMKEIGGKFRIISNPGTGTKVYLIYYL